MQPLSQDFINNCSVEAGYRNRGAAMTRIEVFVDAAFAFAITMLVISIDQIPNSVPALIEVSKQIPAFAVSALHLVHIWQTHSVWSKRFGLEDNRTVLISAILVILILIYLYPLKMMYSAFFAWITSGYLPGELVLRGFDELRYLFAFGAVGFTTISLIFVWMYQHALNLKLPLRLSKEEVYLATTYIYVRWAIVATGVIALVAPFSVPDGWVPFTGFVYAIIFVAQPLIEYRRKAHWQAQVDQLTTRQLAQD